MRIAFLRPFRKYPQVRRKSAGLTIEIFLNGVKINKSASLVIIHLALLAMAKLRNMSSLGSRHALTIVSGEISKKRLSKAKAVFSLVATLT